MSARLTQRNAPKKEGLETTFPFSGLDVHLHVPIRGEGTPLL